MQSSQPYQKNQQSYQRVQVSTADPVKLVVLLYEGAIRNLNLAARLLDSDRETASTKIVRTQDIVNYLRNSLDHAQGGEISGNLERLYEYMRDALGEANIKGDAAKLKEVVGLLQVLLEGWRGIAPSGSTDPGEAPQRAGASFVADDDAEAPRTGFSMMG